MNSKPSIYFVATGCVHPDEKYNQLLHTLGDMENRNKTPHGDLYYSPKQLNAYLHTDVAWQVQPGLFPSREYVLTGHLAPGEIYNKRIHFEKDRNSQWYPLLGRFIQFYPDI